MTYKQAVYDILDKNRHTDDSPLKPTHYSYGLYHGKYLLNSLQILSKYNIIHYDLKENNISYDDTKRIPVIIDFGLSFRYKEDLVTDIDYENNFYIYYDKYPPWCLEIILISFIVQEFKNMEDLHNTMRANTLKGKDKGKGKKKRYSSGFWKNTIVSTEHLINIVEHYFKNNYVIIDIHSKKLINASKKKWITFINTEFQKKTGEYIVRFLMKSWDTWDNYSLCVIYLSLFNSLFSNPDKQKYKLYQQLLSIAMNEDYGDFTDIADGRDFTVTAVEADVAGRKGIKCSILPRGKTSALYTDADVINTWLEEQPDILAINKHHTYESLNEIFQKWANPDGEDETPAETPQTPKRSVDELFEAPTAEPTNNYSLNQQPAAKTSKAEKFEDLFND
jgi:hypothetical protein